MSLCLAQKDAAQYDGIHIPTFKTPPQHIRIAHLFAQSNRRQLTKERWTGVPS